MEGPSVSVVHLIDNTLRSAATKLCEPGDWLTGPQRLDAWTELRQSRTNPLDNARRQSLSPFAVDGQHESSGTLNATMVEVVHRVGSDPGRLTRSWAQAQIDLIGEEAYTELVGITAIGSVLDTAAVALDHPPAELRGAQDGEPKRIRPDGVGDVGAWVSQDLAKTRANVSRTLSLVPETNGVWRSLVNDLYSRGAEFFDLAWQRALSRPQVELLAARTTVLSNCFY